MLPIARASLLLVMPRSGTIGEVTSCRSLLLAVGLVPVLAACVSHGCNAVGCSSLVSVDLSQVGTRFGRLPANVTLCVNGECTTTAVAFTGAEAPRLVNHDLPESLTSDGGKIATTLRVERDSTVLLDTATESELTKFVPNGEKCEPTCYVASFKLVGTQLERLREPAT